jgi:hypothetical protein
MRASWISIGFAALAAALWGASALVNIPILQSGYGTLVGTEGFYAALSNIARLNAGAAACALGSAVAQAVALRAA